MNGVNPNFFVNNLDFILYKGPLMIIIFLIFRVIFFASANYKISVLFRSYSFTSYLIVVIFEGNISLFAFLLVNDILSLAFLDIAYSIINSLSILIFFLIFVYIFSFYMIILSRLNTFAKYLF
jgi:hypothetical protein